MNNKTESKCIILNFCDEFLTSSSSLSLKLFIIGVIKLRFITNDKDINIKKMEINKLLETKDNNNAIVEITNPNKKTLGKIVLKNLLLLLLFSDENTAGDTIAEKKIIEPISPATKKLIKKIYIASDYLNLSAFLKVLTVTTIAAITTKCAIALIPKTNILPR